MPKGSGYQLVVDGDVFHFLETLRSGERSALIKVFEGLVSNPFQEGEYQEYGQGGRLVEVVLIGRFSLSFWADHAVKELRIARIKRL